MKIKKLNESSAPSKETLDDCLQDYANNAFGYDGEQDYVDTQYSMHPQEFKSEIVKYLKQNMIYESKSMSEDTSYEWKPNTSFKHIKDIYNKVKENNYKYVNNEREEFMAAVKKADNKGYKPEQCRQIKDWHRDIWQHNKKNESFDVDKVQKRIARHNEFDNGHVLHDWQNMTSQEAEDKAREASIKNPDDIYYVAYDNIMEPASDIKWKNGKQINESFNDNWTQRFKGMKVFINGDFQIKSIYFPNGKEGWELGTWADSGRYNVIGSFPDIDEAKQKAYDLKYSLGEDLEKPFEDKPNKSEGPYIELDKPEAYTDELDFAGAVEIKGSKVYADEETLRQLCNAIHAEYGWQPKIEESLNELKEHAEIDTLQGPEQGPKVGLASLLTDAIKDEWEAIETYNSLAVTARAEGFEYIANEIDEINTDENTHVGKLQELLKTISPNAEAIELGEDEGKEQLDDIDDDMSEDDVLAYTNKYM